MKSIMITCAFCLSACAGGIPQDKALHLAAGAVTASLVTEATGNPWMGCAASMILGIGKEIYDSRTHAPDGMDALITLGGCSVSITF